MKRVMNKMLQRQLSLGWQGWQHFLHRLMVAEQEEQVRRDKMRQAMMRMHKRNLAIGWQGWISFDHRIKKY